VALVDDLHAHAIAARAKPEMDLAAAMEVGVVDKLGHDELQVVERLAAGAWADMLFDEAAGDGGAIAGAREPRVDVRTHQRPTPGTRPGAAARQNALQIIQNP
jgi:hypothetical protein